MNVMVQLGDLILAQNRLKPYLNPTPFEQVHALDPSIWLKLECANLTHSFKIRGAMNAMFSLNEQQRQTGIIACSSGNHAQAVACASYLLGVKTRVAMPSHTPQKKVNGVKQYGAEVDLSQDNYDDAEQFARQIEKEKGLVFVSPYNDPNVVAGAGTIGLEIIQSMPDIERAVVCVSGGGLIAGVALAIKSVLPHCEVIGVSSVNTPAMYNLMTGENRPQVWETLAEALSGDVEEGSITIEMTRQYVDEIRLVEEKHIADAMRWMIEKQGWVVEGGGAVGVAALLHGVIPIDGKKTAVVVSGGNVDVTTLHQVLKF